MGVLKNLFQKIFGKKTTKDIDFELVEMDGIVRLENNFDGVIKHPEWEDVEEYIDRMLANQEEFVTLTLDRSLYGIRYMQACQVPDGITVELGLEKDNVTKLVEKTCDKDETLKYFDFFYHYGTVKDVETFTPMEFMVE